MSKRIAEYYDPIQASEYELRRNDSVWQSEIESFRSLLDFVREKLKKESLTIFDLPCGTGRWIPFVDRYIKQYMGVDVSVNMLNEAKKKILSLDQSRSSCYQLLTSSYHDLLEHSGERYDLVICTRFLPHFDMPEVDEILEVLRKKTDGYAILMVRTAETSWQLLVENILFIANNPLRAIKRWRKSGRISNSKRRSCYSGAIKKAGFSLVEQRCVHRYRHSTFEYWLLC